MPMRERGHCRQSRRKGDKEMNRNPFAYYVRRIPSKPINGFTLPNTFEEFKPSEHYDEDEARAVATFRDIAEQEH
jgi:hypothetical protein